MTIDLQYSIVRCIAVIVLFLVPARFAEATTWFVSPCGQDFWTGVNVNCIAPHGPKRTIQAAINVAVDGDTVMVMPGTYVEIIDFNGKAITVRSATGPENTTIDSNGAAPVVTCNSGEGPNSILQGLRVTGADTTANGGGMLNVLSSPTIINCRFISNFTTGNGAAMANFAAAPTIIDSIFLGNWAGDEPPAANGGQGGAIYSVGGSLTLSNTSFTACYGTNRGGVIALSNNATAVLTNCTFNSSGGSVGFGIGGGIYADSSTVDAEDCSFDGVYAEEGGSIMAVNGSQISFAASMFTNASGGLRGGAASLIDSQATFIGCEFDTLVAHDAGAIYVEDGELNLTLCGFLDNEAYGVTTLGGAIRSHQSELNIGLCTFTNNICTWIGGAMYVYGGSLAMEGSTFAGNQGRLRGGAVSTVDCALNADSCTFTNNEVINDNDTTVGGGLAITSSIDPQQSFIDNCTFNNNTADVGGGLYVGWTHVAVSNCTFEDNLANWNAGAVQLYTQTGSSQMSIRDSQFIGNSAANWGGAVAVGGIGEAFIQSCTITGNQALRAGGVHCHQSRTILSGCRLNNNVATSGGGAAQVTLNGQLHMFNCVVHNNTSPFGSGAITDSLNEFWQATLHVRNCTIANNTGGGISLANQNINAIVGNTILWENPNGGQLIGVIPQVRYSNVQGGAPGSGNIDATPLFISAFWGNYRLLANSPCIDAGHNWALPADAIDLNSNGDTMELWPFDFDGNPRIANNPAIADAVCSSFGATVDMGAFETAGTVPVVPMNFGDINGDGVVNASDLLEVINSWGRCTDSCCLADLNLDGFINASDLLIVINNWG